MNSKERVKKTFNHVEPDRVPVSELQMTSDVASEILGREAYTGGGSLHLASTKALFQSEEMGMEFGERVMKDVSDLYTALDIDIVMLPWRMQQKPTRKIDENTYYYEDKGTGLWEIMKYVQKADMFSVIDSSIRREGIPAIERLVEAREKAVKEQKDEEKEHVESPLKERLPHLTLWGHIDGYELLLNKTKDEIIAKVIDSLKKGAPGGGYIFDTSTGISGKTPVENFLIMLETAKKYGKYPIKKIRRFAPHDF